MSTIIRANDLNRDTAGTAFNFDDMAARASSYLDKVREEAKVILVKAQRDAEAIRQQAEQQGREAGRKAIVQLVQQELATVLPALRQVSTEIQHAKQAWMRQWEASAIHVAGAIAQRLIRRELSEHPEITLTLVREALELAAGNSRLKIHLNPDDHKAIAEHVDALIDELGTITTAEVVADPEITPGGCRIETNFGVIDQQFEAQIARIEEELTA